MQTPLNDGDKCPSFLIEKRPCCNVAKKNKVIEIRNEKLVCNGTHYVSQYQMEEVKSVDADSTGYVLDGNGEMVAATSTCRL